MHPIKLDNVLVPHSNNKFDILPTTPLKMLHMDSFVTTRLLINYPVPAACLEQVLPPGGTLSLHRGYAWISACIVYMEHMRPSFMGILPATLGIKLRYFVYRTRARVMFPDGQKRECVLILQSSFDNPLLAISSGMISGLQIGHKQIKVQESSQYIRTVMRNAAHKNEYNAVVHKGTGGNMPHGSLFSSVVEADDFLAGVAYGAQWTPPGTSGSQNPASDKISDFGKLLVIPETHAPWHIEACTCDTGDSVFLQALCGYLPVADHAMLTRNVAYDYPLTGFTQKVRM